jgi:N-acetyl-anhydromuramyl-L-alanine amidase AmpD
MILKQVNFPESNYVKEITEKKQIVLHHTVSGPGVDGDINWWKQLPQRIATHYIIDRNGVVHQLFDDIYWAFHLGLKQEHFTKAGANYRYLDKTSIGIELDNWGPVTRRNGDFYPVAANSAKPVEDAYEYCAKTKWKGYQHWELYPDKQLESLRELLLLLCKKHNIPKDYNADIWDISRRALMGESGIFCHVSYRNDKSDPHPQIELIYMLKSLKLEIKN